MGRIVPWDKLCALIAPVYQKAGDDRPPKELAMGSVLRSVGKSKEGEAFS